MSRRNSDCINVWVEFPLFWMTWNSEHLLNISRNLLFFLAVVGRQSCTNFRTSLGSIYLFHLVLHSPHLNQGSFLFSSLSEFRGSASFLTALEKGRGDRGHLRGERWSSTRWRWRSSCRTRRPPWKTSAQWEDFSSRKDVANFLLLSLFCLFFPRDGNTGNFNTLHNYWSMLISCHY